MIFLLTALFAWAATGRALRYLLDRKILDIPNQRSSHSAPTPRGGGVGFVIVYVLVSTGLALAQVVDPVFWATLALGGACISMLGFLDDRIGLSSTLRFLAQVVISMATTYLLGPEAATDLSTTAYWSNQVLTVVGLVWLINAYNFMDGIDGLAGSEAVFVSLAVGSLLSGDDLGLPWLTSTLAGATLGFTVWNWQPAKVFMGDVGSAFLGYVFGAMIIGSGGISSSTFWVWIILLGVFLADSAVTLARRMLSGERWWQAHRSHAYQRLARRWESHRAVTLTVLAVNLGWLAPLAWVATVFPEWSRAVAAAALLLPLVAVIMFGAGLPDPAPSNSSTSPSGAG